jgi:N-acetyl-gamma-glutamyl-phosphate reductase
MSTKKKIGILGASGYTGAELVRLLLRHPKVEIVLLTADRRAGQAMGDVFPQFAPYDLPTLVSIDSVDWTTRRASIWCSARCRMPPRRRCCRICWPRRRRPRWWICRPTSGSRDPAAYAKWYGHEHHALELQKEAVYGLVELYRRDIKKARLVANPGCYTSTAHPAAGAAVEGARHRDR